MVGVAVVVVVVEVVEVVEMSKEFWTKVFPTVMIVLDILAGSAWAYYGNLRWVVYWFAAAVLTYSVTWLKG